MPFPEIKRVLYGKNPLEQVICQLRFPPILKIESDVPAAFQEHIRDFYPLYSEKCEYRFELLQISRNQLVPENAQNIPQSPPIKNHEFLSEDGFWKINLSRTFLAISTSQYKRWEEFKENFKKPIEALKEIYSPPFFTRLGLRYIDVFDRKKLGLENVEWTELLAPHILGLLSSPIRAAIQNYESHCDIQLSDQESAVRIATSFVRKIDIPELCLSIDSDLYFGKKCHFDSIISKLDFLNSRGSRLIRWIITPKLHDAMDPKDL